MRIALCQINPTVGDLAGNSARIVSAAREAADAQAQLAIFPELALAGYPPRDLLDRADFVDAMLAERDRLAAAVPGDLHVVLGFVDRRVQQGRPRLFNSAALLHKGAILATIDKRLLPTYDVFDEDRYFEAGARARLFDIAGRRVGITICEDVWNDVPGPFYQGYSENPVQDCIGAGAELLVNIAASPFTLPKREGRATMLREIARSHQVRLAFVNQVGGNDDLIFDGNSALYGPDGALRAWAPAFEEAIVVSDFDAHPSAQAPAGDDASAALDALVLGTRDYARKCGFGKAVIGLSGGLDSTLVACIAARALEPHNVLGLAMPSRYTSEASVRDARAVSEALGIVYRQLSMDEIFQVYLDRLTPALDDLGTAPAADVTFENIQARIRGTILMAVSNRLGYLLLTTGNKSELAVGYCTLYGDMAGGLAVISDLPKTFIYDVAREVNRRAGSWVVPESTLTKPPSAELRPEQSDQDSLPPYEVLDPILEGLIEDGLSTKSLVARGHDADTVARVARLVRTNEYKRRQMPPGLIITAKAFGPGRRYPIAQKYDY